MALNTIAAFCLGAFVATASAIVAGQQTTATPGQMTQARVTIENQPRTKKGHPPHNTTGVASAN